MASGVRFTAAERETTRRVFNDALDGRDIFLTAKEKAALRRLLEKLEKSEMVRAKGTIGIGWLRAAEAMRGVFGLGLAVPPKPSEAWCAKMNARIGSLGLSESDCRTIARVIIAKGWRAPFSFEKLIWRADEHLAAAQLPLSTPGIHKQTAPVAVEDI